MKPVSPHTPLIILLAVGVLSVGLMAVVPAKGIGSGDFRIRFKSLSSLLHPGVKPQHIDVEAYLARRDSIQRAQELALEAQGVVNVKRTQGITSIQFLNADSSPLFAFFEGLYDAGKSGSRIHVLHYGDSQIEMDRMTGYLREKWQEEFGGSGPGLIPPVPLTPPGSIGHAMSGNWKRYTAYGYETGKVAHNRYGVLASFGRFSDSKPLAEIDAADTLSAWIEYGPANTAKSRARQYSRGTIYFGYHQLPVEITVLADDSVVSHEVHYPSQSVITHRFTVRSPKRLRIEFKGADSPDVHAVLLEGAGGVHMDNIALRGSNGNIFRRIDHTDAQTELNDLNAKLVIMQFGGNAVPYVTTAHQAREYASFFGSQIRHLKKQMPGASFLVIGPSDMSTTIDGEYHTWPGIELVRDAMKEVAFAEGCGYWDMYEVMGGYDSMVSWVNNDPPYAGPDHTHFTPQGARKMAEYLYKAIQTEYTAWLKGKKEAKNASPASTVTS